MKHLHLNWFSIMVYTIILATLVSIIYFVGYLPLLIVTGGLISIAYIRDFLLHCVSNKQKKLKRLDMFSKN